MTFIEETKIQIAEWEKEIEDVKKLWVGKLDHNNPKAQIANYEKSIKEKKDFLEYLALGGEVE